MSVSVKEPPPSAKHHLPTLPPLTPSLPLPPSQGQGSHFDHSITLNRGPPGSLCCLPCLSQVSQNTKIKGSLEYFQSRSTYFSLCEKQIRKGLRESSVHGYKQSPMYPCWNVEKLLEEGDLVHKSKIDREMLESCASKPTEQSSEHDTQSSSARILSFRLASWPEPSNRSLRTMQD